MTAPVDRRAPTAADEDGWLRVEILMPVFDAGKRAWKPVGWLSMNNLPSTATEKIWWDKAKAAWRRAAYNAYLKAHVPVDCGRIEVRIEFRFTEERGQEPSNYELTVKPIIDALQPLKQYRQRTKTGHRLVIELGVGVIPRDDQRHLVRGPELPKGPPLGKKNRIKGMVIVHIKPLPAEVNTT